MKRDKALRLPVTDAHSFAWSQSATPTNRADTAARVPSLTSSFPKRSCSLQSLPLPGKLSRTGIAKTPRNRNVELKSAHRDSRYSRVDSVCWLPRRQIRASKNRECQGKG